MAGYSDRVAAYHAALVAGTGGSISSVEQTAVSLLARALICADIAGRDRALFGPRRLSVIAKELVLNGQSMWLKQPRSLQWIQTAVIGSRSGKYRVAGKSYAPSSVFHVAINYDPLTRQGYSDLAVAGNLQKILRYLEKHLADETDNSAGYMIPSQDWDNEDVLANLKTIRGGIMLVPTQTSNFGGSPASITAREEWQQRRMGFDAPENVRAWYETARMAALAALGIPASLYGESESTAMREGWRMYIFTVVAGMGKLLMEAAADCGLDVELNFDRLMASDIQSRSRAYKQLIESDMSDERASLLTGLGGADAS